MTITKLQRTVVDALEDIKAQDIRVFNTTGLSDLFDRVVLASATSSSCVNNPGGGPCS